MRVETGMWIWAMTLADEGAAALKDLRQRCRVDVASVNLGIYTPYRLLFPRSKKRPIYSMEEGKVYFEPHHRHYEKCGLAPLKSEDLSEIDALALACEAKRHTGLKISAWLPVFANGRLAKSQPELAIQNFFGFRDRLFLCINNPQARDFARACLEDLVSNYEIDYLEIDKIPQTCLEEQGLFGRMEPVVRTLASLCFCPYCRSQAQKWEPELDWQALQTTVQKHFDQSLSTPRHLVNKLGGEVRGDVGIPLLLIDEPLIYQYLRFRIGCVVKFLEEVREMVRGIRPEVKVLVGLVPPVKIGHDAAAPRAWLAAQSYAQLSRAADGINSCIHWGAEDVWYEVDQARKMANPACVINAGVKIYADVAPEEVALIGQATLNGGADGVWFFSYDLADEANLNAVGEFVSSLG